MNYKSTMKSSAKANGFLSFIMSYWWVIAIVILTVLSIPSIIRWIKRQKVKDQKANLSNEIEVNNSVNNVADPVKIAVKTAQISGKYPNVSAVKLNEIKTNAQKMAYALGTNVQDNHLLWQTVDLFNVRAWVEDEDEAVRIAKIHTGTFPILEDFYYHLFTKSRNLKHDLLKYLSKDNLNEIRASHLKYGGFKHL